MKLFHSITVLTVFSTLAIGMSGCQVVKPAEGDLKSRAQTSIGKPVTGISNIRNDFNTTYFSVKTAGGEYTCELPSGPMVALASMGMGAGAQCNKQ